MLHTLRNEEEVKITPLVEHIHRQHRLRGIFYILKANIGRVANNGLEFVLHGVGEEIGVDDARVHEVDILIDFNSNSIGT